MCVITADILHKKKNSIVVYDIKAVADILGIEEENYLEDKAYYDSVVEQFNSLAQKHDVDKIWFKGDYNIYVKGKIIEQTNDLVVVEEQ